MRVLFVASVVAAFLWAGALLASQPAAEGALVPGFVVSRIEGLIVSPTTMAFAPDGRIIAGEQCGAIRLVKNGAVQATPFLSLTVACDEERGVVGMTFDPAFPAEPYVYVTYTVPDPGAHNRISRFTVNGAGAADTADPASEVALFDFPAQATSWTLCGGPSESGGVTAAAPASGASAQGTGGGPTPTPGPIANHGLPGVGHHVGGALHFGPDGYLYTTAGDNVCGANAQSLESVYGKVLRIAKDGSIPVNPFDAQTTGINKAIWAMGLRNPYTFAFQPGTGLMYISETGELAKEEVNQGLPGANYGWPTYEGSSGGAAGYTDPVYEYSRDDAPCGGAIVGGGFYNPVVQRFPDQYVGKYFFTDFCKGFIRALDPVTRTVTDLGTVILAATDLQAGPDGYLYYLDRGTNGMYRVRAGSEHALSAVDTGGEVAVFARDFDGLLWSQQTSGGTFGAWTQIGHGAESRPEAVQAGADTFVFFRSVGNQLNLHRRTGGVWQARENLGGSIVGTPAAGVDADGDVIVVAMAAGGDPWYRRFSGGTWGPWTYVGGSLRGRLELAAHEGNLYLFALDPGGALWYRKWDRTTNAWEAWTGLGGQLKSAPAAASQGNELTVLALDNGGATWHRTLTTGWATLGGSLTGTPDLAASGSNRLTTMSLNAQGEAWTRQRQGANWSSWQGLGGALTAGPELAGRGANVYAFAMNSTRNVWYRKWDGSAWGAWQGLGGSFEFD